DTLVPTTYLVDTTLSDASDYDQTVHAVRLLIAGLNALLFEYNFLSVNSVSVLRFSASLSLTLWTAILICSALIPYSVL
ncbi:hypothetical protein, partial [Klebsiella quasivariicola]|uniref:hypothetical protein n=1 Tax=Klebsiella quasivariicola TaxID=2026240 RepID=UPI001C556E05